MNFRLLGFPVTIDQNVAFIAILWLAFGLQGGKPLLLALGGVAIIFASILWHELGHALAARSFGLGPIAIAIQGFGGLTRHRPSGHAWKDLLVTLAGPGNGLVLGVLAYIVEPMIHDPTISALVWNVASINLFWSVFNLLPMFPMDGGQALYAVLRMSVPKNARRITGGVGLAVAGLLVAFAILLMVTGGGPAIFLGYFAVTSGQRCWQLLNAQA